MSRKQEKPSAAGPMALFMAILNAIILEQGMVQSQNWYVLLFVTIPLFIFSIVNTQSKVPGRLSIRYRFRKTKKPVRRYWREKEISAGRKSSRPEVGSAQLVQKTNIHI